MSKFSIDRVINYFKSPQVWGYLLAAAVCWLLAFMFFYPEASEGGRLQQYDMLQGLANGHETQAYAALTGETPRWTNSLFGGMPTFQISPSYPSNSLFDWLNTLYGMGLPSPSNLLMMMMLGFLILMASLRIKPLYGFLGAVAFGFSSYWIIIIGAGHLWKFITVSYVPPTIAGVILAYRGRYLAGGALAAVSAMMQIASNHIQMSYYFAMVIFALVVAYLVAALRRREMKRWGIATGVLAIAAIAAIGANSPSLYNTYKYSKLTMRGGHSELSSAAETESNATDGLNRDYITTYSYQPDESLSLLIPNIKGGATGHVVNGRAAGVSLADDEHYDAQGLSPEAGEFVGMMPPYFGDAEGTSGPVYAGAIICALFILGCLIVKGPLKWALLVMTVLSVCLAMGRHFMSLTDLFIDFVPMYSKFRTVESILVIAQFAMPLLGVLGLQKLLTADDPRRYSRQVAWSFGVPLGLCLVAVIWPSLFGPFVTQVDYEASEGNVRYIIDALTSQGASSSVINQYVAAYDLTNLDNGIFNALASTRSQILVADAWRSFWFLLLGGVMLYCFAIAKIKGNYAALTTALVLTVLVVGDLYNVDHRYLNSESFARAGMETSDPIPATDADRAIKADAAAKGLKHYRVMSFDQFTSPLPSYHHSMIGGYHAAKLTRYQDLIDRHISQLQTEADFNVLNMLNARYFMAQGQVQPNPNAYGNGWFVDSVVYVDGADAEMDALGRIDPHHTAVADTSFATQLGEKLRYDVHPADTIELTDYAPDRLAYRTRSAKGGLAVFSEVYFPWGWNVEIDGKPVTLGRVDYVLRALPIPAGEHKVTMTFDPQSLHTTNTIAVVSIILIYLSVLAAIALGLWRTGLTPKVP